MLPDSLKHAPVLFEASRFHVRQAPEREVVVHPGSVAILPILESGPDPLLVLIRNRRVAVGETLWEVPAGTLEADEEPIACAGRELIEETGYEAASLTPLTDFYTSPGICSEHMHAFKAQDLTQVGQDLEAYEDITVEPQRLSRVLTMIRQGEVRDGKTIAMVLLYDVLSRG